MFQLGAFKRCTTGEHDSTDFVEPFVQLLEITEYYEYKWLGKKESEEELKKHARDHWRLWLHEVHHLLALLEHLSGDLRKFDSTQSPTPSRYSSHARFLCNTIPRRFAQTEAFKMLYKRK